MIKNASNQLIGRTYKFRDFAASWAGSGRDNEELCFGSEDGRILFTNTDGDQTLPPFPANPETYEAVNGVAFLPGNEFAVSTRQEVTLLTLAPDGNASRTVFRCGAHDV